MCRLQRPHILFFKTSYSYQAKGYFLPKQQLTKNDGDPRFNGSSTKEVQRILCDDRGKRSQHSNNTVDMRTASEDNSYITIVSSERWLALVSAIQVATDCLMRSRMPELAWAASYSQHNGTITQSHTHIGTHTHK